MIKSLRHKGNILLPIVIAVLILGTGVALLATKTWNPLWNPFSEAGPIEKAIAKISSVDSLESDGDLNITLTPTEGQAAGMGSIDITASFVQKSTGLKSDEPKSSTHLTLGGGAQGIMAEIEGEIRNIGENIYIMIESAPTLTLLSEAFQDIQGQWYRVGVATFESSGANEINNKAMKKDLVNTLRGKNIFKVKKREGKEKINDVETTHYVTELNKQAVKELIPEVLNVLESYVPEQDKASYEERINQIKENYSQNFEEVWSKISPFEVHFWIEEGSKWIRKMSFEKTFQYDSADLGGKGDVTVSFESTFSNFNEDFEIEEPEDSKPIDELLSGSGLFLPGGGSTSTLPGIPNISE